MAESQTQELVAKRNSTSIIWNWFSFYPKDKVQTKVICKVCTEMVCTMDGNTMNLFSHLKRKHPKQYAESQTTRGQTAPQSEAAASVRPKQTALTQACDKDASYEKTSKQWKESK